jgi:accessory gene regulator protein AgrB
VSLFFRFLYSAMFILFITCYPFGIVFTWSLLCYIVSSILIVCNCFLFGFHHASYIYIYLSVVATPQVVFCFKEIQNLPHEDHQTCDAKFLYQFWHCKFHFAFKKQNY